ncbi:thiol:disulfide interchange protein DsbD [Rhodopseudomonas thermotolerans]|uniref:Thiol:disulfide interchange protein DsbD n=2 Tax=Rhodopseudomonas TaxID=1073 RepID=A0A336JST0_9BRAD|nr:MULTISPECIES: protein-disulfide reductase DsbD [Rhodopseudomonas]RED33280.1 thiol:disulfide interchange protein DsbD [Rhodopseudomonas pentothenatexigens]REF94029.1 thiol:disulfide interchange protein DsbD [Rhodopseudomonas thermotolerans]SSW91356.1 thiol:disulfide interchange protein DsbD [Rhodopseudomonas pentothenatexigens]
MANRLLRIVVLLAVAAATLSAAQSATAASKEPSFRLAVQPASDGVTLRWTIAPGDYLYRDKIVVRTPDGARLTPALPQGETKDDPNFGITEVYHRSVEAAIPAAVLNGATRLSVGYQGCAERGICYPPVTATVDLASATVTIAGNADTRPQIPWPEPPAQPGAEPRNAAAPPEFDTAAASVLPSMTQDWLPLLLAFAGFGLLLALTPCVLPMVPIVAGMLTRAGRDITPVRGFTLALIYTLGMASAYAALGVAAAWSGQNLQAVLQTPAALAAMAAVYVALALSSFGLFELQLPARFGDALTGRISGRAGPLLGAAALGFASALIVGPCVTPPLAAALLYVAQTGDTARGAAALFALGLGMGFPLMLVGTFGGGVLPRSGPWLVTVHKLFGVVFLAIATALLARILPASVSLLLWAVLAIGTAVFFGAFDRIGRPGGAIPRLGKAAGLALFVYGAALIVGAAAGADDPLRPLAVFGSSSHTAQPLHDARTVTSLAALDAAIAEGRDRGTPIMIDFSADWCTACKTMEREVFAKPEVQRRLAGLTVIRADVTATTAETAALMQRFDVVGPPTVVFLDARDGDEVSAARVVGEVSADAFTRTLKRLDARS